jgi:hypothetical protein
MLNISTATTAELVAFYNQRADKPVKKFADRKTAERRVAALIAQLPRQELRVKPAAKKAAPAPGKDRGAAIAESWKNKKVAAARATRHAVRVEDKTYKSVREAFMVLALPLGQHIKFRGALKAAGKAEFAGLKFKIV